MDFKQIEAFVNVVRYKSFSRAADATFFTQPTISTHVATLEKELGVKLLDRHGRNVEMTAKGRKFYNYAVEMVNTRAQAIDALDENSDSLDGVLEIMTSSIPGIVFLPEMVAAFRKEHPLIQFYVSQSDTQEVFDSINDRRGEIGFVGAKGNVNTLNYTKIFSDKSILVAPKSFGITKKKITLGEAVTHPFIWRETGSATRKAFEAEASDLGFDKTAFNVAALFNDLDAILRSVEQGVGVTVISEEAFKKVGTPEMVAVDIEGFTDKRDFYMITRKGVSLSPIAQAFRNYVINNKELAFSDDE